MSTPSGRLRELLAETDMEGQTASYVAEVVAAQIPLGDALHWMRQAVTPEVRRSMKEQGLVIGHANGNAVTGPALRPAQMPLPQFVDTLKWRRKQINQDRVAYDELVDRWLQANPGSGETHESIAALVESEAA